MVSLRKSKKGSTRKLRKQSGLEIAEDVVKTLLQWIVVSACGFAYWMLVLCLISIFLMNIWHTTMDDLLQYGLVLAGITSVVYAGMLVYRKLH